MTAGSVGGFEVELANSVGPRIPSLSRLDRIQRRKDAVRTGSNGDALGTASACCNSLNFA